MSALLAVCQKDAVHLLTDAMAIKVADATVGSIHPKQYFLRAGMVIAGMGYTVPNIRFARLVNERVAAFDDLAKAAPSLCTEVRESLPPSYRRWTAAIAGYSEKAGRVLFHVLVERDGTFSFEAGRIAHIAGPGSNGDYAMPFHAKLCANPDDFDPVRDGAEFMEMTRRQSLRDTEIGPRPAVGGFIQLSTVTVDRHATPVRTSIDARIVKHWPDRVGQPVDLDAPVDFEVIDETRGISMAHLAREREGLVRKLARAACAGPPACDVEFLRANPQCWRMFDWDYATGAASEWFHRDASGPRRLPPLTGMNAEAA